MSCVTRCALLLVVVLPSVPVASAPIGDDPASWPAAALCRDLPRSLWVDGQLRPTMVDMCRRAATFRRQLARIAEEPDLAVTLEVWRTHWSDRSRAVTQLHRERGHLRSAAIKVRVDDADRVVELIAHEFEHILEQLDNIDLNRWVGRSGVYRVDRNDRTGAIETARANYVGRKVAEEYALTPLQARTGDRA